MKRIHKSPEPTAFTDWKQSNPNATFDDLSNGVNHTLKQTVKNYLLAEQKHICCYCENRIDSRTSHIEHLLPQSTFPQSQLDYTNLLASCEADGKKAHCGHKKDRQLLPITPLDANDPSQHFVFAADGNVYPRDASNNNVISTIDILGLNAKRLVSLRSTIISTFIGLLINSPKDRQQTLDSLSHSGEKLYEFYSAIRYQIDQLTTPQSQ